MASYAGKCRDRGMVQECVRKCRHVVDFSRLPTAPEGFELPVLAFANALHHCLAAVVASVGFNVAPDVLNI